MDVKKIGVLGAFVLVFLFFIWFLFYKFYGEGNPILVWAGLIAGFIIMGIVLISLILNRIRK